METPLTPLEFGRRARRLYGEREAVVDGSLRLTYEQFFRRADRWSAALQRLGVGPGDRVAYIAPNTHQQLESFYAVPQIGAVLVPINFRLAPADFAYIINHSGARVVCVHADYLSAVEGVRAEFHDVRHFIALGAGGTAWLDYEELLGEVSGSFVRCEIGERDLLTINYTSGTTSRPKGVMITHRNAYMNVVGTLVHLPMTPADRYLWTLPMFHANGWTFTWTVTAAGGVHVCAPKIDPRLVFDLITRERITVLCARADGAHRAGQCSRGRSPRRPSRTARRHGGRAARGCHDSTGRGRLPLAPDARVRAHGNLAVHHRLRVAPRARPAVRGRPRSRQGEAGR